MAASSGPPSWSPGSVRLLPANLSGSPRNLLIARSRSCDEATVELGGFIATNAIAAAVVRRTLALVMRTSEKKRVRLNGGGVFIYFYFGGLRFWLERIGKA